MNIVCIHHPTDKRLAERMRVHLAGALRSLGHRVGLQLFDDPIATLTFDVGMVVVLLSPDMMASAFFTSEAWTSLSLVKDKGELMILGARLCGCLVAGTPMAKVRLLPFDDGAERSLQLGDGAREISGRALADDEDVIGTQIGTGIRAAILADETTEKSRRAS